MTTKRFTTTEIVEYRKSSTTKQVSFDTLEEATAHVLAEKAKHPRSKKFIGYAYDTQEKINHRVY